jgi:DNA recombination protein RmuC
MSGTEILAAVIGAAVGAVVGGLIALLARARREQTLRVELEQLRARQLSDEAAAATRERELARVQAEMQSAFGDLARDSLKSNNELFLQLARERLTRQQTEAAGALKERETAIEGLVRPIREALAKTEAQIGTIERDRIDAFATLKAQMEALASGQTHLSRETRNLVTALRRPDVRGQWGEITLRRVVELSGMSEHVDFSEQLQVSTDSGVMRPDMVVHMPERRDLVIDVKTPLDAYLAAAEAQTEEERATALRRHSQLVGARVRELASKRYWAQFEHSPAFVILFLPGDQFLTAAFHDNPTLIDESLRQNVMLATPTSLLALLKTVAYGWKQSLLADNAQQVRRLGEELYKRLAVFSEHLAKAGRSLGSSVESFNRAVGSLDQQVMPAARRFPELGLRTDRSIEVIEPLSNLARVPREQIVDELLEPIADDAAAPEPIAEDAAAPGEPPAPIADDAAAPGEPPAPIADDAAPSGEPPAQIADEATTTGRRRKRSVADTAPSDGPRA